MALVQIVEMNSVPVSSPEDDGGCGHAGIYFRRGDTRECEVCHVERMSMLLNGGIDLEWVG